jgi:uncharacterized protein YcnI
MRKTTWLVAMLFGFFASVPGAWAHVTVHPQETAPGSYEKFTVRVPTESEAPTVKVEIAIPDEVTISRVEPKPGWSYELIRDGNGRISRVVWSADGPGLASAEFGEFNMLGRVGSDAERIVWKAYQTYGDGETVAWDGAAGSSRPASITTAAAPVQAEASASPLTASAPAADGLTLALSVGALMLAALALMLLLPGRMRR